MEMANSMCIVNRYPTRMFFDLEGVLVMSVSFAFVFALLSAVISIADMVSMFASVLIVVGLLLLYRGKKANRVFLALGGFIKAVDILFLINLPAGGLFPAGRLGPYYKHIELCTPYGAEWALVLIYGSVALLMLQYIMLFVRGISGKPVIGKRVYKLLCTLYVVCAVLNVVLAFESDGALFSVDAAVAQMINFVLVVLVNKELNNDSKKLTMNLLGAFIIALALAAAIVCFAPNAITTYGGFQNGIVIGTASEKHVECRSCGRSFEAGTSNAKSIARTGMCSICYGNFDSLKDFLNK